MKRIIENCKVLVCVGSGGVGKTTVAVSTALQAASMGKKVLVMTIDPSRRLATALGLDTEQSAETRVDLPWEESGELWASLLRPKEIFDDFVRDCAPSAEHAQRILENRLYQQLSTTLSGSQEFTSLSLLYEKYIRGEYDLLVLDTPPTQHALDFFEAPKKIHDLFQSSVTQWFIRKKSARVWGRFFESGTSRVIRLFESLTGAEFMSHVYDFFTDVEPLQQEIQERSIGTQRMLAGSETSFLLVTGFEETKLQEAQFFREHILQSGYGLSGLVVNRAFPEWYLESDLHFDSPELEKSYKSLQDYYDKKNDMYADFAKNLRQMDVFKIAEKSVDVSSLEQIKGFLEEQV